MNQWKYVKQGLKKQDRAGKENDAAWGCKVVQWYEPVSRLGLFYMEFACSPHACVGFLQVSKMYG